MTVAGRLATRLLWLGLWSVFAACSSSHALLAQQPTLPGAEPPPQQESGGDPTFGYFVYVLFAGLTLFLVCKSARRANSGS
jgi:hypothetical protein